jgi:hypothetical protein
MVKVTADYARTLGAKRYCTQQIVLDNYHTSNPAAFRDIRLDTPGARSNSEKSES